jgi:hypothetical protein
VIRNGHAGFGRGVSERDHKAPRRGPTSPTRPAKRAREVKARYRGVCRGCGAPTSARNGKGDAYAYCKRCRPGAIEREWTRERVREAIRAWHARYGSSPSSYDWSWTHASKRGPDALARLQDDAWPAASTVTEVYGSFAAARADAVPDV